MEHCYIHIRIVVFLLFAFSVTIVEARDADYYLLRGEQLYAQGRYLDALSMFEKYEQKAESEIEYNEFYLHRKAEANFRLARFEKALECYMKVLDTDADNVDYDFMKTLIFRCQNPSEYKALLMTIDSVKALAYASINIDTISRFFVNPVFAINTENSEFAAVEHDGKVFFSANTSHAGTREDYNTLQSYYEIYSVDEKSLKDNVSFGAKDYRMLSEGEREVADSIGRKTKVNLEKAFCNKYNDGPIAFSNNNAYITTNIYDASSGQYHLSISKVPYSERGKDKLSQKSQHYFGKYFAPADVGHITFSKDGKHACMVVKKLNSKTGGDLWFAEKRRDGSWGRPRIGNDNINTEQDEAFPYWADDNYLYYSTSGLPGMGGLDVYRVNMSDPNSKPQNLGVGVNTPYDDFALTLNSDGDGYLTSNRAGGQGEDDIYSLALKRGNVKVVLEGSIEAVENPMFSLRNKLNEDIDTFNIKEYPTYVFSHLPYGEYDLNHGVPVDSTYQHLSLYEDTMYVYLNFGGGIQMDSLPIAFTNFCFDCDGMGGINDDQFKRMVEFLKAFPEIRVCLTGNTDMFGSDTYNDALGMRRAEIMERWLREEGVVNQIIKSSNGKRKLISLTDHLLNRRVDVEFYWPGDTVKIMNITNDNRLENDLVLSYDKAEEFDKPIQPGYYILVYRANHYMDVAECARRFGVGEGIDVFLHSTQSDVFNYYLDVPFENVLEAQEVIESLELKAKVVFLP